MVKKVHLKQNIIIYGNGVNGKWVYNQLKQEGFDTTAILDDNYFDPIDEISIMDKNQFWDSEYCNANTVVIIAFFVKTRKRLEQLKKELIARGISPDNIYHFIEIFMDSYFDEIKLKEEREEIEAAYSLLSDGKSRRVFRNFMNAVAKKDANLFEEPTNQEQYFDREIITDKISGEGYFVDCGAYVGDTFQIFILQNMSLNYIGFEPDLNNFKQLSRVTHEYKKVKSVLFPCATSDRDGYVNFSFSNDKPNSPGSAISQKGNILVPAVKLDSVISGLDISYLKMDVEGAEASSLSGAKNIIIEQHPNLAICTYHKTEDIWKLVNQIYSYNQNYSFYLKSYYLFSRETVLYAIYRL